MGCSYVWNDDGSAKGCLTYDPFVMDLDGSGNLNPIVEEITVNGQDRNGFINENYFGRTLFKKDFTIELLVKVTAARNNVTLFTINSYKYNSNTKTNNGSWSYKFNFTSQYVGKLVYFALVYNSHDAFIPDYEDGLDGSYQT